MSDNIDTQVEAYNENAMIETLEYIIERLDDSMYSKEDIKNEIDSIIYHMNEDRVRAYKEKNNL